MIKRDPIDALIAILKVFFDSTMVGSLSEYNQWYVNCETDFKIA